MNRFRMVFAMLAALAVIATMAALGVVLALAMAREDGAGAAAQRAAAGDVEPRVPGSTLLRRALGKRCPRCGRGAIFSSYFGMNPRCGECDAVFWVDQGEWLGAFVIDWACATGAAIVVWAALEAVTRLPQIVEIAIISVCVMASLFATFPWSRSFWTVFLYLTGAMGERPARAQDSAETSPPSPLPPHPPN
ncbi:MAG TPA: hypothetical protein VNF49_01965 [Candidatus Binataceae bacterium]|nr:hypothetical protein [Candidatus Binataceae bacterium]